MLLYGPSPTLASLEINAGGVMICGKQTRSSFFLFLCFVSVFCVAHIKNIKEYEVKLYNTDRKAYIQNT